VPVSAMSSVTSGYSSEGWIAELITRGGFDAELEKTHAYALGILLPPGLLLLWYNLVPFLKRGTEFQIEQDGSVTVRAGATWPALLEFEYSSVIADGTTIEFRPPQGRSALILPQQRVFSRQYGVRRRLRPARSSSGADSPVAGSTSTEAPNRAATTSPPVGNRSRPSQ
jgi:hypothetical protein